MNVAVILLAGIILYILFRVIRLFLVRTHRSDDRTIVVITSLELILWTFYFFWIVERLFESKSYYTYLLPALVFVLVVFVAWFYFKDLIAGALFKIQHGPRPGRYLQVEQWSGVIKSIHATHLVLQTSSGGIVKIPYSKLQGNVLTQHEHEEHAGDLKIRIWPEQSLSEEDAMAQIRRRILLSPYCSFKKPVTVRRIEGDSRLGYEVVFTAVAPEFVGKVEELLKEHVAFNQSA